MKIRNFSSAARGSISESKQVLEGLAENTDQQAQRLKDTLETFIPRAEQVIEQTIRRVFQDEKVPADEKIVFIFEPHTAIIRRGRVRSQSLAG